MIETGFWLTCHTGTFPPRFLIGAAIASLKRKRCCWLFARTCSSLSSAPGSAPPMVSSQETSCTGQTSLNDHFAPLLVKATGNYRKRDLTVISHFLKEVKQSLVWNLP